jgi:Fe-S-cluster containining protein
LDEAVVWAKRGHGVEILVKGGLCPRPDYEAESLVGYIMDRSLTVAAGQGCLAVQPVVAAAVEERCPNLGDNNRCAIYEERPRVCRIYPAEINPFTPFSNESKRCPPESWDEGHGVFVAEGGAYEAEYAKTIAAARRAALDDMKYLPRLCSLLSIDRCALATEGFVAYKIAPDRFLEAIQQALNSAEETLANSNEQYMVLSNQKKSLAALSSMGISCAFASRNVTTGQGGMVSYLGYYEDDA